MHHREPRSYAYDECYGTTNLPPNHGPGYPATSNPHYHQQYDGSNSYYAAGAAPGAANTANPSNHYSRSMTPVAAPSRYYPTQASSSSAQPVHPAQSHYYAQQNVVSSDRRSHHSTHVSQNQFIPTPSDMAYNNYNNYNSQMPSGVPPPDPYASEIGYQIPMVPSSTGMHRPSRITTGRPRTTSGTASTSPTSASSPSGERFACEQCGKTFSRSHDRKRHYETQHNSSPVLHRCRFCEKEFSRADSLKRHLDNGCDEMP